MFVTSSDNVVRRRQRVVKGMVLFFFLVFKFHFIDKVWSLAFKLKSNTVQRNGVNFFVAISKISSGGYTFVNLVDDIVHRCPAISHLNSANIRIRYQDDEGSYINLIFGDEYGFRDMWDNAKNVPDREYRRIKNKSV